MKCNDADFKLSWLSRLYCKLCVKISTWY